MAEEASNGPEPERLTEPPTCNCALLCNDVIVRHSRDMHTLEGVIGNIGVKQFPGVIGGSVCYVRLSNVYPSQTVRIALEDAGDGEDLFSFDIILPSKSDPLGVYTIIQRIPAFGVASPGRYMFTASSKGIPLAQSPIMIQGPPAQEE